VATITSRRNLSSRDVGLEYGFRSGLEEDISSQLRRASHPVVFEDFSIPYRVEKNCSYTPDFLLPNGIIIESKGRFVTADRQKHLMIQKQHPALDIRFVFSRSKSRISKTSRTSYGMWCEQKCFRYADKIIPSAWLSEARNTASLEAVAAIYRAANKEFPF
jgi:hypothetical protein